MSRKHNPTTEKVTVDFEVERDGEVLEFKHVPTVDDPDFGILVDGETFDELTILANETESTPRSAA